MQIVQVFQTLKRGTSNRHLADNLSTLLFIISTQPLSNIIWHLSHLQVENYDKSILPLEYFIIQVTTHKLK